MATTSPAAVALRAKASPSITVVADSSAPCDRSWKVMRMPSTVPNRPTYGALAPTEAITRNTREPGWFLGYIAAGPMTGQFFYESAAYIAAAIALICTWHIARTYQHALAGIICETPVSELESRGRRR